MSRYIDADALIADLDKGLWGKDYDKALAEAIIDSAPSIDIVRCGECKWRKAKMMPKSVECLFSGKDDDFCSYGERLEQFRVGLEYHTDTTHFGKVKGESITTNKVEDETQTEEPPMDEYYKDHDEFYEPQERSSE